MSRRKKGADEERALDLIERGVHLLRTAPLTDLLLFYVGAVPFILGILFFLADMSTSPFAAERCALASLGVALLYIWMRSWQSIFCRRLSAHLAGKKGGAVSLKRFAAVYRFHLVYSTWAVVVLPLSAIIAIPFGWVYAYFNNLCIVDCSMAEAAAKARALAMPRPKQNHVLITVLLAFGYFVVLNWVSVLAYLPSLLKSLVGIETAFSQSWHWIANTTFIGVVIGLAYLVVEPLVKAVYVLRFHACESIETGEDLLVDLKNAAPRRRMAAAVRILLVGLFLAFAPQVRSAESGSEAATIDAVELDSSVDRIMKNREFTWRMPRELVESEEEMGFFARFMDSVFSSMEDIVKSIGEAFERFLEWLGDAMTPSSQRQARTSGLDPAFFKGLSVLLLVVLLAILAVFLIRAFLARRAPLPEMEEAELATVKVDLEDENVIATMLEEDGWIALAREQAAKGEYRTAMRAWFLAGLAYLSRMGLLGILHSKSNLDYRRELLRRARRCPDVVPVFGENIILFERAWYGLHPATAEDLGKLESNLERMRHGVEA